MAAQQELLGPDSQQAAVGTEQTSLSTNPQGGLSLVDGHSPRLSYTQRNPSKRLFGRRSFIVGVSATIAAITSRPDSRAEAVSDPFNPENFVRNGKKGVFDTTPLTSGDLGNGRSGVNDTTRLILDGEVKADIQINGALLLPQYPDVDKISTVAKKYNPNNDLAYFLIALGQTSRDQRDKPLAIVMMPLSTINDPSTQSLMKVDLPSLLIPSYTVTGYDLSNNRSRLNLTMNNQYQYGIDLSTWKVEVLQVRYTVNLPITGKNFLGN
jgi:hypothetical protein